MFAWIDSENIYTEPPVVHRLDSIDGFDFIRPELIQEYDPYVLWREVAYKPGTSASAYPLWQEVVHTSKDESGTIMYGVYNDTSGSDNIVTVEAYKEEKYLQLHERSTTSLELKQATKDTELLNKMTILRLQGDFFYKPPSA